MKEIVIDDYGTIMDEGCGCCSHVRTTGRGWKCVFTEDDNGSLIGTEGCRKAQERYRKMRNKSITDGMDDFLALRKKLHDALKEVSKHDPGKSYEGEIELYLHFTGIYDDKDEIDQVCIKGHFYLIGPYRHYEWKGNTLRQAVVRAAKDIDEWIAADRGDDDEY